MIRIVIGLVVVMAVSGPALGDEDFAFLKCTGSLQKASRRIKALMLIKATSTSFSKHPHLREFLPADFPGAVSNDYGRKYTKQQLNFNDFFK